MGKKKLRLDMPDLFKELVNLLPLMVAASIISKLGAGEIKGGKTMTDINDVKVVQMRRCPNCKNFEFRAMQHKLSIFLVCQNCGSISNPKRLVELPKKRLKSKGVRKSARQKN